MKRFIILLVQLLFVVHVRSWSEVPGERMSLRDVEALTLYKDHYTTGRRSSPVPQLKCVGGSAGCGAFVPEVVQCVNKGWDGVDAQWECKTDMGSLYRFGHIEVSCEGYSHPNDPFILKGSCGLEYKLELTEEGRSRAQEAGNVLPGLTVLLLLLLAYGVYKLLTGPSQSPHYPGAKPGHGFQDPYPGGCASNGTGDGFWTGLGTGGMLGYLFGRQRGERPTATTTRTSPTSHTSSGFGGTKRR